MNNQTDTTIYALQNKAKVGDAQAQLELAVCYSTGEGVEKNVELALQWLKKSAEQGQAEAQFILGFLYLKDNQLVEKHIQKYVNKLVGEVIQRKSTSLIFDLLFESTQKDESAFFWLKKAAEQNHAGANFWLGLCYQNTVDTEEYLPLAFANFKNAAEQGYQEAYYKLALCYHNALGTQQNDEQAFQWLTKAVEETDVDPDAYLLLAHLCYFGHGTPQNRVIAYKWYGKATVEGVSMAHLPDVQFQLAKCYLFGIEGISVNYETGMQCLLSVLQNHHAEALQWMEETYLKVAFPYFSERNDLNQCYDFAYKWLSDNVKESPTDFETHFCLGILYAFGKGVAKSHELAIKHFNKSLNHCADHFEPGEFFLELLYNFTELYTDVINGKNHGYFIEKLAPFFIEKKGFTIDGYDAGSCAQLSDKLAPNGEPIVIQPALRFAFQMEMREYDELRAFLGRFKQSENTFTLPAAQHSINTLSLMAVDQAEELDTKNQELNNMIAMFAHNFLGTLQCIRSNAEHENNPDIHLKTVKMMGGALTAFSIISADDDKLIEQLKQDKGGETNLQQSLSNNLALAISQLLSKTNKDKIINLYLKYLIQTEQIEQDTTGEELRSNRTYRKKWQALQHQWEDEFNALFSEQAELYTLQTWIADNFFPIQIVGFNKHTIRFKEYGITDSIFLVVFMEIFVNALKYIDVTHNEPLVITLSEQEQNYTLLCENPSSQNTGKGTHKGIDFLQTIANKLSGSFNSELTENSFKTSFIIPAELLK
jgi:TPR repeat protein